MFTDTSNLTRPKLNGILHYPPLPSTSSFPAFPISANKTIHLAVQTKSQEFILDSSYLTLSGMYTYPIGCDINYLRNQLLSPQSKLIIISSQDHKLLSKYLPYFPFCLITLHDSQSIQSNLVTRTCSGHSKPSHFSQSYSLSMKSKYPLWPSKSYTSWPLSTFLISSPSTPSNSLHSNSWSSFQSSKMQAFPSFSTRVYFCPGHSSPRSFHAQLLHIIHICIQIPPLLNGFKNSNTHIYLVIYGHSLYFLFPFSCFIFSTLITTKNYYFILACLPYQNVSLSSVLLITVSLLPRRMTSIQSTF